MDDAILRGLIKAAVVVAVILVVACFRFFVSSSPRATKWMIAAACGLVLLVVAYAAARRYYLHHMVRPGEEEIAAITVLVDERRDQIERVHEKLTTLRELVSGVNWLPDGRRTCSRSEGGAPLYYAFQLRGTAHADYGDPHSDLDALDSLEAWAADPGSIRASWWDHHPESLAAALDRSDLSLAIVVELTEIVTPKVKNVKFAPDGRVSADFVSGRVEFRLGVVDTATGEVLACGGGGAQNSPTVKVTGNPDELEGDLREQTRRAAVELAAELISQNR